LGYIYVIKNEVGGLGGFKIGKTIDPARRFKELQLGAKASLVGLWCSEAYSVLERQLHITYKQFRVPQSEWFALTSSALQQVISKLNRSARQVQLEEQYRPTEPVVVTTSVTQAVKPNGSTYPVPVRSHYSGPNPVWTDYTGKTRELPSPLPAATQPVSTTSYSPATAPHPLVTQEQPPAWCGFFGFIPLFGWLVAIGALLDFKSERYTTEFKIISVISALMSVAIAANSEPKPLTNYQLESPQNVSSLIY
jgi:hypothetical protein